MLYFIIIISILFFILFYNSFDTTRRNLMYLDNSGRLFINKVNLNDVSLENIDGKLFWGEVKNWLPNKNTF